MSEQKTVAALTLGCKVNAYDTESMLALFREAGYSVGDFNGKADVYIINTCTVTAVSDKKSRQMIRRAAERNPGALIVAAGCFTQTHPEEAAGIPGVDIVLGAKDRASVVALVENYRRDGGIITAVKGYNNDKETFENLPVTGLTGRTRAYVKIQDGCRNFCSYCIIPYARGPVRSREISDITDEVKGVLAKGAEEIVITGISVASYGADIRAASPDGSGPGLVDALYAVSEAGAKRVRLSSLGPSAIDAGFIQALRDLPGLCSHVHLSLQSGCDKTLARMNRRYTAEAYAKAVEDIRRARPLAAVTTDIIAGFPGEEPDDFQASLDFIKTVKPAALHVFPYSKRPGTAAAAFPDAVSPAEKERRVEALLALGKELKAGFIEANVGDTHNDATARDRRVLFETEVSPGVYQGFTGNYIETRVASTLDLRNRVLPVILTRTGDGYAEGRLATATEEAAQQE